MDEFGHLILFTDKVHLFRPKHSLSHQGFCLTFLLCSVARKAIDSNKLKRIL